MTTMRNPVEEDHRRCLAHVGHERFHADKSPFEAVKDSAPRARRRLARDVLHRARHHLAATR